MFYLFQIFFRDKIQDEEGYILFVRKNALQVLIPKYGLEGTLYLNNSASSSVTFTYNSEDQSQTCGDVVFRAFDPIVIQMSLDRSNVQHEKLFFKLVKPEVRKERPMKTDQLIFNVLLICSIIDCRFQRSSIKYGNY